MSLWLSIYPPPRKIEKIPADRQRYTALTVWFTSRARGGSTRTADSRTLCLPMRIHTYTYRYYSSISDTLSRSIFSSIALLIKPFRVSPLLAANSLIACFFPFFTTKEMRSQFSACHLFLYSVFPAIVSPPCLLTSGAPLYSCTSFIVPILYHKSQSCARYKTAKSYTRYLYNIPTCNLVHDML